MGRLVRRPAGEDVDLSAEEGKDALEEGDRRLDVVPIGRDEHEPLAAEAARLGDRLHPVDHGLQLSRHVAPARSWGLAMQHQNEGGGRRTIDKN